ncbi:transposase [Streptomyces griseus]|uniref:transposase n=1 Tax=Streptomyces griseus TaxID=1911 RepID=UPI0033C9D231
MLQFLLGLSDRRAAEAVRCRIDFKYAMAMELKDPGFHHRVLADFRDRLAEGDRADRLLDLVLARLKEAGLVRERTTQSTDSTHVLAAVKEQLARYGTLVKPACRRHLGYLPYVGTHSSMERRMLCRPSRTSSEPSSGGTPRTRRTDFAEDTLAVEQKIRDRGDVRLLWSHLGSHPVGMTSRFIADRLESAHYQREGRQQVGTAGRRGAQRSRVPPLGAVHSSPGRDG